MRYYIEAQIDGKPVWWRRSSYGIEAGWVSNIREASSYGNEGRARLAVFQMRRHNKIVIPCEILAYHVSPIKSLGYWPAETVNARENAHH